MEKCNQHTQSGRTFASTCNSIRIIEFYEAFYSRWNEYLEWMPDSFIIPKVRRALRLKWLISASLVLSVHAWSHIAENSPGIFFYFCNTEVGRGMHSPWISCSCNPLAYFLSVLAIVDNDDTISQRPWASHTTEIANCEAKYSKYFFAKLQQKLPLQSCCFY